MYVLGGALTSYILLKNIRKYIVLFHLYPKKKSRDLHKEVVPNFLGAGFVFLLFLGSFFYEKLFYNTLNYNSLILALFIITAAGVRDDLFEIASKEKLVYELIAINLLLVLNPNLVIDDMYGFLGIYEFPYEFGYIFTVFMGISIINSFNLIDGIDGNAGFNGILSFGLFGLLFWTIDKQEIMGICMLLIAILIGYLFLNFDKKNKGFMGDTGSLFLGFLIFTFTLIWVNAESVTVANLLPSKALIPLAPLCIFILPLIDTLSVYSYRIKIGKNPLTPDNYHLHHLALRLFSKNHLTSALFLNGLSLVFCTVFSILVFNIPSVYTIATFFISVAILVVFTNKLRKKLRRRLGRRSEDVIQIN